MRGGNILPVRSGQKNNERWGWFSNCCREYHSFGRAGIPSDTVLAETQRIPVSR
ncbi:hypothetical protein BIZ83_gp274 [Erwinia phage vB_EamM_ChrisDB]|uniref:hypothetical protein n=1 Tax=Erwinia phage vB_EamM_ChrisDB TaxID=1883371 RepID=UPI00081C9F6A|nr:hypothetical protein BIZ83_gp274 [Erwinia phage vB_EamM_ChrisDB]ANZ48579.1 hypothetical protein CHRISDB_8 [Erwinia phage vB_EamM_ChrisDB]